MGLAIFIVAFGMPSINSVGWGYRPSADDIAHHYYLISSRDPCCTTASGMPLLVLVLQKMQTIMHHVLPLAMPGMLTGTIIGMAQALGETAPLLMIGMVAFIVDVPGGVTDPGTVLPVQIFMWADFAERMFIQKPVPPQLSCYLRS